MLALIETTPYFADLFFPEPLYKVSALIRILAYGLRGTVNVVIGLMLYPFAVYTR
jgi:hypothetical protein